MNTASRSWRHREPERSRSRSIHCWQLTGCAHRRTTGLQMRTSLLIRPCRFPAALAFLSGKNNDRSQRPITPFPLPPPLTPPPPPIQQIVPTPNAPRLPTSPPPPTPLPKSNRQCRPQMQNSPHLPVPPPPSPSYNNKLLHQHQRQQHQQQQP